MTDRSYRQPWEPGPPSPYSDDHPSFLLGVALHALKAIAASEHVFDTPQQYAAWVVANIEMTEARAEGSETATSPSALAADTPQPTTGYVVAESPT